MSCRSCGWFQLRQQRPHSSGSTRSRNTLTPTGSGLFHERVVGAKACAAISNLSAAAWRGTLFEVWASEAIVRLNNGTSHRRPFAYLWHAFETFAARHDLHAMGGIDCTHFCHSPMLYAPVWRMLLGHFRPPGHVKH